MNDTYGKAKRVQLPHGSDAAIPRYDIGYTLGPNGECLPGDPIGYRIGSDGMPEPMHVGFVISPGR